MVNNSVAIITTVIGLWLLFHKKIRQSPVWHATVTPLASIIGSGFLVSAPLLLFTSGRWAALAMLAIVLYAYAVGASIRYNIAHVEPLSDDPLQFPLTNRLENLSRPTLGLAYVISVAFYLKLLSAFALRGLGIHHVWYENSLTTVLLLFIGITGKFKGLSMLEWLETFAVNTKLSIIIALIVTFFFYNTEFIITGHWNLQISSHETWWTSLRQILGMLIIVQGFETSRYLGHAYDAATRITTMRYAQWISGAIYVIFVTLSLTVFNKIEHVSETGVIDLCQIVASALPFLLIIAAILSQFSAAIADTIGGSGLLTEAWQDKFTVNTSYIFITCIAIILTWITNIYEIITIASKAFALYYALQILLTLITLKHHPLSSKPASVFRFLGFLILLFIMIMTLILGIPVE